MPTPVAAISVHDTVAAIVAAIGDDAAEWQRSPGTVIQVPETPAIGRWRVGMNTGSLDRTPFRPDR